MIHERYRTNRRWRKSDLSPNELASHRLSKEEATFVRLRTRTIERRRLALGLLLILSFLVAVRLAAPLWVGIVFGLLMAFTMQPLHNRLQARMGGRLKGAALVTTLGTSLGCLLLGTVVVYVVASDLSDAAMSLRHRLANDSIGGLLGDRGHRLLERLGTNEAELTQRLQSQLGRATVYVTAAATLFLGTATVAAVALLIGSITMYYTLVDWSSISLRLERVLPLDPRHTRALVLEFRDVGRSALMGILATAAVQSVVASIGYTIFQLPHAISFGILTGIASFVPVVATALVWVPVSIYFFWQGAFTSSVLLAAWGLFLVTGFGEYVLRPRLVGGKGKAQPLLMLVAALGGVQLFGLPGIVVGPVLMSLFLAILRIYEREADPVERISAFPPVSTGPLSTRAVSVAPPVSKPAAPSDPRPSVVGSPLAR